jgi:hypothetical protein
MINGLIENMDIYPTIGNKVDDEMIENHLREISKELKPCAVSAERQGCTLYFKKQQVNKR